MSRQEFHFQEGNSQKFWVIDVEGRSFTVQFGRLGTAGQTQTREFASDAEAQKAANKLIAEKTKKGYVAINSAAASTAAPAKPAPSPSMKKQVASAVAVETASAPPAALTTTRSLNLSPHDWLWATWRPRQPLPKPAVQAFDLGKALAKFQAAVNLADAWADLTRLHLSPAMSREEAHFWLFAVTTSRQRTELPPKFIPKLEKGQFDGQIPLSEVLTLVNGMTYPLRDHFRVLGEVLPFLLTPADYITAVLGEPLHSEATWFNDQLAEPFLEHVLPHLTAEEVETLKPLLRDHVKPNDWPNNTSQDAPVAFRLAAALGMWDEMAAVVNIWLDNQYQGRPWEHAPQVVVFGLGDADQVSTHMRRLALPLSTPQLARAWLAHTECAELDLLRDSIAAQTNKKDAEKLFEVLSLVNAPEVAPHMLALQLNSKVQKQAGEWLDNNPGNAFAGLIPIAAGKDKLATEALQFLREAKKKGHADFIASQLQGARQDLAAAVREKVLGQEEKEYPAIDEASTPKPLRDALAAAKATTGLPSWSAPSLLPPILVGGRRLADSQVSAVLDALRRTPIGTSNPLLDTLKTHAERASMDTFVWSLCERWLSQGAPSKEKWALLAIGHLGGDSSILKLTPLVRTWPGESQHARAVVGLECLRAIGSDTALMQLNGIAQKLKFQGLKNKAKEFMEAIAKDKGLTREELEDRIVPDLDLDERGSRVLDFGPRQFQVALDADLTPVVRDADGKVKTDLPKPGAKDDTEKATTAVADWKILKKLLRETLKVQVPRLEQAMVTGRRWTPEQFETLLVRHPLMTLLAQRLLWGGYDAQGKLLATFRVTEEKELADAAEKQFTLKGLAAIGILHPLHLTAEQLARWGEVFGDYEIITPFPQLGRPVLAPNPDEAKGKTITRLAKVKLPPAAARFTLEKLGWTRGSASDHGIIGEFGKVFPGANVTAVVEVEPGIPIGMADWAEQQSVPRAFFVPGLYQSVAYPYHKEEQFLALNTVDPVAVSELLADLAVLGSKVT